ncbi:MAG: molybdenum hydroxylase family protein large subunit, partial [Candidatus Binatus sp.]|nr:molybdenum hydroxylase family protein large subunit [Candidatus Binatus sp.]
MIKQAGTTAKFIGARVRRVEDPRVLLGRTTYVDDVRLPNTLAVAFVRSPYAHARIISIDTAAARQSPGVHSVLTSAEAEQIVPTLQMQQTPSMSPSPCRPVEWPVLATGKARFVGEAVVAIVADSRALAEDAAELINIEWDALEPVTDPERAQTPGAVLVHEEWPDNIFQKVEFSAGEVADAFSRAPLIVSERFRSGRHMALPMEGRGIVASFDAASQVLTVWASTQMPHVLRAEIARVLKCPESFVRVIAIDVGGGFGLKAHIFPEELLVAALARRIGRPVEWIEDRREHLMASQHAKDQIVRAELAVAEDGTLMGLRAHITCDIGAYTEYPWRTFEANVTATAMPGPYKLPAFQYTTVSVATNKCSIGAYRGVGQPIGVFAMERLIDIAAARLKIDRIEMRRRNMIAMDEHPYDTITGDQIESGSHRECLAQAAAMIADDDVGERKSKSLLSSRRRGTGFASFVEATAPSSMMWQMLGPVGGGSEPAMIRVETDGSVTVAIGTNSQGQGHETVFAQVAATILGVELEKVRVIQGDTASTPRGWFAGGSRVAVVTGGAVIRAASKLREKIKLAASRMSEIPPAELELRGGSVYRSNDQSPIATIAEVSQAIWLGRAQLPAEEDLSLEFTARYEPP